VSLGFESGITGINARPLGMGPANSAHRRARVTPFLEFALMLVIPGALVILLAALLLSRGT
jgi:hypothetical protein